MRVGVRVRVRVRVRARVRARVRVQRGRLGGREEAEEVAQGDRVAVLALEARAVAVGHQSDHRRGVRLPALLGRVRGRGRVRVRGRVRATPSSMAR